jgi:heptaprenyl diphosphate synthase
MAPARAREELRALVGEIADDLETAEWAHSNRTLHTVVAVLPELPRPLWSLLDEVQAELKPRLARRGMMLGQFHPDCPEPAARNPRFRVSRSPLPLLAIRRMALHDVLFLHRDPALFAEYRRRFGDRYARGTAVDPLFRQVYEEAAQAMSEGSGAR